MSYDVLAQKLSIKMLKKFGFWHRISDQKYEICYKNTMGYIIPTTRCPTA